MIFNWRFWRKTCPRKTLALWHACQGCFSPSSFSWKSTSTTPLRYFWVDSIELWIRRPLKSTYPFRFWKRNPNKAFNFHWSFDARLSTALQVKLNKRKLEVKLWTQLFSSLITWTAAKFWKKAEEFTSKIWHFSGGFIEVSIKPLIVVKRKYFVTKDSLSLE